MKPGRRYWLWSVVIGEGVCFAILIPFMVADPGQSGGVLLVFAWAVYWLLGVIAVAAILYAAYAVKRTRLRLNRR